MRFRGLLVAVVLLAALGVGLYFSNKEKAAEAAKPPADAPPKILALTEGDITKVDAQEKGRRRNRCWRKPTVNGRSPRPSRIRPIKTPPAS